MGRTHPGCGPSGPPSIGSPDFTMAELPQCARNSHCSPSRCSFANPVAQLRPARGMSADPRQPYTHQLHRAMCPFGRTPFLQDGVVPDLWRPRRLPMPFSNSLPQCGSSAPALYMSIRSHHHSRNPPARLSLYTHIPSNFVSSYFGLVTLSERPITTIHSFLFGAGSLPRWQRGRHCSPYTLLIWLQAFFCHHTVVHSRTALSTSYIPLIRHTLFSFRRQYVPRAFLCALALPDKTPRCAPPDARCRSSPRVDCLIQMLTIVPI